MELVGNVKQRKTVILWTRDEES